MCYGASNICGAESSIDHLSQGRGPQAIFLFHACLYRSSALSLHALRPPAPFVQ